MNNKIYIKDLGIGDLLCFDYDNLIKLKYCINKDVNFVYFKSIVKNNLYQEHVPIYITGTKEFNYWDNDTNNKKIIKKKENE